MKISKRVLKEMIAESIIKALNESFFEGDVTYYNGDLGKFITSDENDWREYNTRKEMKRRENMGVCPKESDPKGLLDGVTNISGSEYTRCDICAVFDKKHPSAKYGITLASCVWVGDFHDETDRETYREYRMQSSGNYYCIEGCVCNIKGEKVFDMYLS